MLGNFIPNHFTQTVESYGSLHSGTCGAFAYTGHTELGRGTITYQVSPVLRVVARNKAGGITRNYRDFGTVNSVVQDFMMLDNDAVSLAAVTQDVNQLGALGTPTLLTSRFTTPTSPWREAPGSNGGEHLYTLSALDNFVYTRDSNAFISQYVPEFDINIASIDDDDGVSAVSFEPVLFRATQFRPTPSGNLQAANSNLQVRYGRLVLANSFGPETSDIAQPFTTEFLTDPSTLSFEANTLDTCSQISVQSANWQFTADNSNPSGSLTSSDIRITGSSGNIAQGQYSGVLLNSKGNNTVGPRGSIAVEYTTPDWLKFDWNGDGMQDNASAIATFGRYRGNDRIIYWREVNN